MLNSKDVENRIVSLLNGINPCQKIDVEESLFSVSNQLLSRDVAYLLLELEKEYGISIDDFVRKMDEQDVVYSVKEIARVLCSLV